jgi:hypothetical protein
MPLLEDIEDEEQDDDAEEVNDDNDDDDKEDPFDKLDPEAKAQLMENTQAVCTTSNKVCIDGIHLPSSLIVLFTDLQAIVCYHSLHHHQQMPVQLIPSMLSSSLITYAWAYMLQAWIIYIQTHGPAC